MKKVVTFVSLLLTVIFLIVSMYVYVYDVYANVTSYYSETNAPFVYGLTYAEIRTNDSFSLTDSRFRVFAYDFEDGDLTYNITSTNDVNPSKQGTYHINYEVIDSDNNKTTLTVTIKVIDNLIYRYYERTIYSLEDAEYQYLSGTNRGNFDDRQILGFYMDNNSEIEVKQVNDNNNLKLTYLNNDSNHEQTYTLTNDYQTITSKYDGVPFIMTPYNKENTIKIGIKVKDNNVYELPYYHYNDNENTFFNKWTQGYSVIESSTLTVLIPIKDKDTIINNNSFNTIDNLLNYYNEVLNEYDEYIGLSYNPTNYVNQNIRTKYFIKPDTSGNGLLYYAWDHIGISSDSVSILFNYSWGILHELAHGYQGHLSDNDLEVTEVTNNILAYFIQNNKNIYKGNDNWLGDTSSIEESINNKLNNHITYKDFELKEKLYVLVNLLNTFDSKKTYAKINELYRSNINNNLNYSMQDYYVLAFKELYNVNVIPYFEKYGIEINNNIKTNMNKTKTITINNNIKNTSI